MDPRRIVRRTGVRAAVAITGAVGILLLGVLPASAATSSGTQSMTATLTAGTVAITAPATFSLGTSIAPGSTVSNSALGALAWTDTENDATASSVTLAATDLCPTSCTSSNDAPYTGFTVAAGSSIADGSGCTNNTGTTPAAGAGGTLSGTDTTPGTTFSSAVTLATGSTTTEGCWSQTGNTITVKFPANIASASLTSTLQYTVTG